MSRFFENKNANQFLKAAAGKIAQDFSPENADNIRKAMMEQYQGQQSVAPSLNFQ